MIVVEVRQENDVRWAFFQQLVRRIPAVPLQEKDSIPQDRVGQHTDVANVYQDGCVADIVYLSQAVYLLSLVGAAEFALAPVPRGESLFAPETL